MYEITYRIKALREFEESIEWYEKKSIAVAENFIEKVRTRIAQIKNNPYQYARKYKQFHEVTVEKYPFNIVYLVENERIIILSVFHHKRNPKGKYRK